MEYVRHPQYSRCDQRFCAGRTRAALAADLINTDLRLARRRAGRFLHHSGASPRPSRLDRFHGEKSHNYLCDSRPRRSLLPASIFLERFPKARFVAAPSAIEAMKEQSSPEFVAKF